MNIKFKSLLAALAIGGLSGLLGISNTHADTVETVRVLGEGNRCDHVIGLITRHGVNNSVDLHASSVVHSTGFGGMIVPTSEIGDLQLKQVTRVEHDGIGCEPTFNVVIHNASIREVCNLRVTAVALLGRIRPTSPSTVVKVSKVLPGQLLEIQVKLPSEALTMGGYNGTAIGFRRLLVAIDSFDQFVETNEANNIRVFDLSSIPIAIPAVQTEPTATSGTTPEVQIAPDVGELERSTAPDASTNPVTADPMSEVHDAMKKMNAANTQKQLASSSLEL